ncbi:hypothetical protein HK101_003000 [Irineochytrium annulatum]|nr:hypothetical protein HK101_003000 [Irineochytrium annulatum]
MTVEAAVENIAVSLKSEPEGWVTVGNMEVQKSTYDPSTVVLGEGSVEVKLLYISLDPYLRGRMRVSAKSYSAPFTLGEPMSSGVVGEVTRSATEDFPVGTVFMGMLPWVKHQVVQNASKAGLRKIDTSLGVPVSYYLGILGMPGMTAYVGLVDLAKPKKGETLYVSAASGAVGLVVCQIGKLMGLRVVGSAGSDDKVEYLKNVIGVDGAFNYKTEDTEAKLSELCPNGIDIYFENVGGEMLDIVLTKMNNFGRIPVCGMISQYNVTSETAYGLKNATMIIGKRLLLQGFIVSDHMAEVGARFVKDMGAWIASGQLQYKEHVDEGMENLPKAMVGVLKGENFGKALVKV